MKLFRSIVVALLLSCFIAAPVLLTTSCSTTSSLTTANVQSLVTPAKLYAGLVILSAGVISKVSAGDKVIVHRFAVTLGQLTTATVDGTTIAGLLPQVSADAQSFVNPIINLAITELNLALVKFGSKNATVLAYANAISSGLIDGGF